MRLLFPVLVLLLSVLPTATLPQSGDATEVEPLQATASGEAYLQSLRYRGIDTDVRYFDPTRPVPPLETTAEPPRPERDSPDVSQEVDIATVVISLAVILAVFVLLYFYGGQLGLSLGSAVSNPERDGGERLAMPDSAFGVALPKSLQDILSQGDRRAALMALAQYALARVVTANGLRLQKSWTVRDALRRLPADQSYLAQLRALVLAAEGVHFGGRDVTDDEFTAHLNATRPLLAEASA